MSDYLVILIGIMIPLLGTTLGSGMVFFMKNAMQPKLKKLMLGFASGVMIAASVWSLIMPAINMAEEAGTIGWIPAAVGFLLGVAFLLILDTYVPHIHADSDEPEGKPSKLGKSTMLVFAVTLHNIPEGMAVSVPLISGGMTKTKAVLITAASGIPTILGALLGYLLGEIGPLGLTLSLGFASGAMLYVVFGEILPQSILMYHSKLPAFSAIVGILAGLLIIFV